MARETFENWIPDEVGGNAIQALSKGSAVIQLARPEPMASDTKRVPRSGGFTVGGAEKGGAYANSAATNDYVELIARKAGGYCEIADEDLQDPSVDVLKTKRADAARELAKLFDNSCFGTTSVADGVDTLYTSVYKAITTTNSATGYTANDNLVQTGGDVEFDDLNDALGLYEDSDWFDEMDTVVIASPAWKRFLRGVKDLNDRPILNEDSPKNPTVLNYAVTWSQGARTSTIGSQSPSGNPLLIICNRQLLIRGVRPLAPNIPAGEPGFAYQPSSQGNGFTKDTGLMKAAIRGGFAVGHEKAFVVIEKTAASS